MSVKRTGKIHSIALVREPRIPVGVFSVTEETAYAIASNTPSGVTWYWEHEVEART